MAKRSHSEAGAGQRAPIPPPPLAGALFGSARYAWLWLAIRVWVGWVWLAAGRDKLGDARWTGGDALGIGWGSALGSSGSHQPARWSDWIGQTLAIGQTLVGIAILLGLLTGLAALAGVGLAVTIGAAADPLVVLPAVGLVLAWRCAGWIGLDRWVLPIIASRPKRPGRSIPGAEPSGMRNAPGRMPR